ncbi:hypothetical protein PV458_33355 [Streptomyces sp. MN03-5084-2B]|nr:hypothetical protein [Streptomyces sp. MN03-5084-2B]
MARVSRASGEPAAVDEGAAAPAWNPARIACERTAFGIGIAVEGGQVRWDVGVPDTEAARAVLEDFYTLV